MKRFACLATVLPLLFAPVLGQIVFHDDFHSSSLNRFMVDSLDKDWTLYNDENRPSTSPDLTYFDEAWKIMRLEDGDMCAASPSFFRGGNSTADRWMVTPALQLTDMANPTLSFRAKALNAQNRDGFVVKISTNGKEKESFTKTLSSVSRAQTSWQYYTLDLSEYKGGTVHIAFIQNSKNQYIVGIDDVMVYDKNNVSGVVNALSTPFIHIADADQSTISVKAEIFNTGSAAITSYTLCRQLDNGEVEKEEVTKQNIAAGKSIEANQTFNLTSTGFHTISLWLEKVNGQEMTPEKTAIQMFAANNQKLPKKNMLLEMFSSGICTSCPGWNHTLHLFGLEHNANMVDNRGNFCMVKYQVNIPSPGDPCVTDQTLARGSFYNISAAPSFVLNGNILSLYDTSLLLPKLRESIKNFSQTTVPTGLTAYLERTSNTFKIHVDITDYLPDVNDYNLVVCLLEDSIQHRTPMHNGESVFYYTVRQMLPDVSGMEIVPEGMGTTISKDFEFTFGADAPNVFSSVQNINAVVFLQNQKTQEVTQARYLAQGYKDNSIIVENEMPETIHKQLFVYPNPVNGSCRIKFISFADAQATMELIDMQGKTISSRSVTVREGENQFEMDTQKLSAGFYFVRVCSPAGVFVHKIVKR